MTNEQFQYLQELVSTANLNRKELGEVKTAIQVVDRPNFELRAYCGSNREPSWNEQLFTKCLKVGLESQRASLEEQFFDLKLDISRFREKELFPEPP